MTAMPRHYHRPQWHSNHVIFLHAHEASTTQRLVFWPVCLQFLHFLVCRFQAPFRILLVFGRPGSLISLGGVDVQGGMAVIKTNLGGMRGHLPYEILLGYTYGFPDLEPQA